MLFIAAPAGAQSLQLGALNFPPTEVVGPWVSYLVRTQSGTRQVREYTQRVAIVSKTVEDGRRGFWVELKTTGLSTGTRIERGLFLEVPPKQADAPDEAGDQGDSDAPPPPPSSPPADNAPAERKYRLTRYQVLTPGGKLYEYPASAGTELRMGSPISTFELFEFDARVRPLRDDLGPDTLRIGRRVVPVIVDRTIRLGSGDWTDPEDSARANQPLLVQTYWRNSAVPLTGFAKSLFQVGSVNYKPFTGDSTAWVRARAAGDSIPGAPSDSLLRAAASSRASIISWTELVLLDLGSDAVPEVTQKPEPLPAEETKPSPGSTH